MQFKLCPDLQPSDVCLVVEQYRDGGFERRFHKHVPRERLADPARLDLLLLRQRDGGLVRSRVCPQAVSSSAG
jgi:hypothetical protein